MTSSRFIIGLFGLLLLSSVASAYTVFGSAFYCTNCTDCTDALNNNTYNITYLNATISGAAGTCINDPSNIDGKIFDCNGYTISGTQTATTFGIFIDGESDARIIGCEVSGFTDGYYITDGSDNITVIDGIAYNNTYAGIYVLSSDNINIINSTSYNNTIHGFRIRNSGGCYLDNDEAYDNTYGFDIYTANLNTINNSVAHDNSLYGLYIRQGSMNNTVWNTYAYNNSDRGFVLADLNTVFNRIYSSNATNNTNDGFYLSSNNWTWIIDTRSNLNGRDGYRLQSGSRWINITNGTAFDNTADGFAFYTGGIGYLVAHSESYGNGGNGLHCWGGAATLLNFLTFSEIHDNGIDGILLDDSCSFHGFRNNSIYSNTGWGFHARNAASSHLAINTTIYDNSGGGMFLDNSDTSNYTNLILYNNSAGNSYAIRLTSASTNNRFYNVLVYNETNYIYQQATAATANNFTNLTLGYSDTIGLANWNFLNITDLNLTVNNFIADPEFISMDAGDSGAVQINKSANLTILSPACTDVYPRVKTGFPQSAADIRVNGTLCTGCNVYSCVSNVAQLDVPDWSGYAMGFNISECMVINSSGTYKLFNNLEGAPLTVGTIWGINRACILIESDDVDFTCNGYNITNNGTANAAAIAVNASFAIPYTNITIRDCPGISAYREGIYTQNAYYNRIQNSTAYGNTEAGFLIVNGIGNNLTDNTAYAIGGSTVGFYLIGNGINLLLNNTAYRTNIGFYFNTCSLNNITNNWAYNNTFGFYIFGSGGDNNQLWYNRAETNSQDGFRLRNVDGTWLVNNSAWGNHDVGFYLDGDNLGADNNWLINNTAYSNWDHGFYLFGGSFLGGATGNWLINNTARDNTMMGFNLQSADNNNLTDNTAFNNSRAGFYLTQSLGNKLISNFENYSRNSIAGYGFQLTSGSTNNVLIDNEAYGNYRYGFDILANSNNLTNNTGAYNDFYGFSINSDLNRLLDNTAYLNYDGISLNSAEDNVLTDNEAYDNTRYGFFLWTNSINNNFTDNDAHTNGMYGFYITAGCDGNDFISNDAYGHNESNDAGFYADTITGSNFISNNVYQNHYGLYMDAVSGNNFTDNDVYNNTISIDGFSGHGFYFTNTQSNRIYANFVHGNNNGITFDGPAGLPALFQNNDVYNNSNGIYFVNNADNFDFNNTNYSGNDVYDNTRGIRVEGSDNTIITKALLLHDNVYEVYGFGLVNNLTIEETNTPEEEYVTLANGAAVTNLYLMYDYADVHGRVLFPSVTATAASADKPLNNTNFLLEHNFVSLNDSAQQDYNVSATVTLNTTACPVRVYRKAGFPQTRDDIVQNGTVYNTASLSCSGDIAEFDVTSFSGYAVDYYPPPPPGRERERPCTEVNIELVSVLCPDNVAVYRVTEKDSGATVRDGRVVLERESVWWWSDVKFTNSSGEVAFALPDADQYYITLADGAFEDYCRETVELKYFLCPEEACYEDDDCEDTEYCERGEEFAMDMVLDYLDSLSIPGVCMPVPCECGEVYGHECHPYECCADEDCPEGYRCEDNECVSPVCDSDADCGDSDYCSDGTCIPVPEGACGYVENHTWFDFDCCKDEDCPPGYFCYEHECILYRIETNETGFVGDDHGAQVYPEGQYELTITDPDGRVFTVDTDENGYATFLLETEGQYGIALLEENVPVVSVDVQALKSPLPPPPEKPVTILDELLKYFWWLLILLLLIIGYLLFRRKRKKKYRTGA